MTQDWRLPYRSMDAAGHPEAAHAVAWAWIETIGRAEGRATGLGGLSIETPELNGDSGAIALYRGADLLALCTLFRDPMNFCVLVRWLPPESPHG